MDEHRRPGREKRGRAFCRSGLPPGRAASETGASGPSPRETAPPGSHPGAPCRMGDPADPRTVVDPSLRVVGVPGLRVADASVMPTMVSVNIAPTCFMIGHRAATLIAGKAA